jgi:allantoin racemase
MRSAAVREPPAPPMRLLYIFPRTTPDAAERAAEHARRRSILRAAAGTGTTVDIQELENCPPAIESARDAYAVAPAVIDMAARLEHEYDGMIVGCFEDPAVDGAIEATAIPIIGCGLPSMGAALLLGPRFAVLSPTENSAVRVRDLVMRAGLLDRYAGSVALGIGVREFARDPSRTLSAVSEAGARAVEHGADVLLLGCLSLAFTGVGDDAQRRLGVPVVNPVRVAVRTCEMLVACGLAPRRVAHRGHGVRRGASAPVERG